VVKWYTVAPINLSYKAKAGCPTKSVAPLVNFIMRPDWLNRIEGLDDLLGFRHREVLKNTFYVLLSEYEASPVIGDLDPKWQGRTPRTPQESALERLQIANLGLWLTKPSWLGFEMALHIYEKDGYRAWRQYWPGHSQSVIPNERDENNYLDMVDYEKALEVNSMLQQINRDSSIWIAARTLWMAITTRAWEVRFLLLWIALEALFGTRIEIAYRISHRIAFFLSSSRGEAEELYRQAKTSYRWRSQTVHGMKLGRSKQKKEESKEVLYRTETFARRTLLKILNDSRLIGLFSSNKSREEYLGGLVFSDLSG